MFHWSRRNDVLETIPNIYAVSKGKVVHQEMYTFNSEQADRVIENSREFIIRGKS